MEFSAQQIAGYLKGTIEGNPDVLVSDFAKIEEGRPGTLSFLSNPKYTHFIYESQASVILVNKDFQAEKPIEATLIRVENAYESLAALLILVEQSKPRKTGISSLASISSSAKVGEGAYIAPFVHIGDEVTIGENCSIYANTSIEDGTQIGDNVIIYAGVKLYNNSVIGNHCILHAGCVIGADGFGFAPTEDGAYKKIPQTGNVVLEDNVELGANMTIDRATMGSTVIRKGVKIDNLVQIAHNVEIGSNTVIAAQTGIAGSTKVGEHCTFAGQVGVGGHVQIANHTILAAQTGIAGSIKKTNQVLQGYPAIPIMNFQKSAIVYKNLPELQKMIYQMQQRIEELEQKLK